MCLRRRVPRHNQTAVCRLGKSRDDGLNYSKLTYVGNEVWITKDRHTLHAGCDLLKQFQPFPAQTIFKRHKAGDVATWPRQTFDEASAHWIGDKREHDRHGTGCLDELP